MSYICTASRHLEGGDWDSVVSWCSSNFSWDRRTLTWAYNTAILTLHYSGAIVQVSYRIPLLPAPVIGLLAILPPPSMYISTQEQIPADFKSWHRRASLRLHLSPILQVGPTHPNPSPESNQNQESKWKSVNVNRILFNPNTKWWGKYLANQFPKPWEPFTPPSLGWLLPLSTLLAEMTSHWPTTIMPSLTLIHQLEIKLDVYVKAAWDGAKAVWCK